MSIEFKNTDALTLTKGIASKSIDLVLTDPPYLIARDSGFKSVGKKGVKRFAVDLDFGKWDRATIPDHEALMLELAQEWFRCLKDGGTTIVWYDIWKIQSMAAYLENAGFKQLRFIEWIKTNPVPLNSSRNYLTNSREIAITCVKKSKPTFHSKYDNGVYSAPIHRDGGKRLHPTQKPLGLTTDLINKHSNPGDTILDTFAGSATHLVAAHNAGRNAIGCELDEKYYKLAQQRVNAALKVKL
jgi:DNA modification methylase